MAHNCEINENQIQIENHKFRRYENNCFYATSLRLIVYFLRKIWSSKRQWNKCIQNVECRKIYIHRQTILCVENKIIILDKL